jgi:hypothetical protein
MKPLQPLSGRELAALGVSEQALRFALWVQALWGRVGWTGRSPVDLAAEWQTTDRTVRRWQAELVERGAWAVVQVRRLGLRAVVFLRQGAPVGALGNAPESSWEVQGGKVRGSELLSSLALGGSGAQREGDRRGQAVASPSRDEVPADAQMSGGQRTSGRPAVSRAADTQRSGHRGGPDIALSGEQSTGQAEVRTSGALNQKQQQQDQPRGMPKSRGPASPAAAAPSTRGEIRAHVPAAAGALAALAPVGLDPAGRRLVLEALEQIGALKGWPLDEAARKAAGWALSQARPPAALCTAARKGYLEEALGRGAVTEIKHTAAGAAPNAGPGGSPIREEDPMARAWDMDVEACVLALAEARQGLQSLEGSLDPHAGSARCRWTHRLAAVKAAVPSKVPGGTTLEHLVRAHIQQVQNAPAQVQVALKAGLAGWRSAEFSGSLERLALWALDYSQAKAAQREGAA